MRFGTDRSWSSSCSDRSSQIARAVANGLALRVFGEEGCRIDPLPQRITVAVQAVDAVGVVPEAKPLAISAAEPRGQLLCGAPHQRKYGQPVEGAVGFLVVGICIVARD